MLILTQTIKEKRFYYEQENNGCALCYWFACECYFFRAYGQRNSGLCDFVDFIVTLGEV